MGADRTRSRKYWAAWHVLALAAMLPTAGLLGETRDVWEQLLNSQVPHSDSDALNIAVQGLTGLACGFVVWCLAWLVPRGRPRAVALVVQHFDSQNMAQKSTVSVVGPSGEIAVGPSAQLLVYGTAGEQPRRLGTTDNVVLVAPDSDRILAMSCEKWTSYEQRSLTAYPLSLGVATATPGCVGRTTAHVVDLSAPGRPVWSGDHPLTISPDGRYVVDDTLTAVDVATGRRTPLSAALTTALTRDAPKIRKRWALAGTPLITGFWHSPRTVEVTRQGTPVALCTLPEGPCRRLTY